MFGGKINIKIALKCIILLIYLPVVYLSFLNHQTLCNDYLNNPHCPLNKPKWTQSSLKMMPSDFEDHLIIGSIAIWLLPIGRNGLELQLYCWRCCSLLLGKQGCVKYVIFYSNMHNIGTSAKETGNMIGRPDKVEIWLFEVRIRVVGLYSNCAFS